MANLVKLLRVKEAHFVGNLHLEAGKILEATHPLVAGLEHLYEEVQADLIGGMTAAEHQAARDAAVAAAQAEAAAKAAEEQAKADAVAVEEKAKEDVAKAAADVAGATETKAAS